MQLWQEKLKSEYELGQYDQKTFLDKNIDIIPGKDRDAKRYKVKTFIKNLQSEPTSNSDETEISTCSFHNGAYIYDRIISVAQGTMITKDIIMKAHNIDPKEWEVVSFKSNFWQAQKKGGQVMELYQSKVVVKPKLEEELSFILPLLRLV